MYDTNSYNCEPKEAGLKELDFMLEDAQDAFYYPYLPAYNFPKGDDNEYQYI